MANSDKKLYPNKPAYKTLSVTLDSGTSVQVSRAAVSDLDTLLELQDRLLQRYVEANGMLGTIIANSDVRSMLSSMCGLLPLVGKASEGQQQYLQFDDIQENWEQLITLFFNGSFDEASRTFEGVSASKISELHFFPFLNLFYEHVEATKEKDAEKEAKKKD